jgi:hypothetical protein
MYNFSNKITFLQVDYPDIDPNEIYEYDDLINAGYTLVPSKNKKALLRRNEIVKKYGIPMQVVVENYDLNKIAVDYEARGKVRLVQRNGLWVIFTDGIKEIAISVGEIANYSTLSVKTFFVLKEEEVADIIDDEYVEEYIKESFVVERNLQPDLISQTFLSKGQILGIENISYAELYSKYDENNPNIYAKIVHQ